ncbi:hypothetical protein SLS56_010460 [Neofusicoccum ribis]|uniref:Ankyrin repeat protein n=1 Tax=Neofusicoccum ribis TaxID=45134 RepID=A0ABR3SF70_9PEZI
MPNQMWLRDYLPKDAPNARILTWEYQSNLQADESTSILADFTNTFFQRLIYMRRGREGVTSKGLNSHRLPMRAIIFLGAPHNGLASDSYKILETLVKGRVTQQLLTELKTDSPTLRDLSARFIPIAKEIEILTCYDTMETKTVVQENGVWKREGEPMMMVAPSSAVMHGPTEKKIASSMDHSQLAKVKKGENGIYPDIKSIIRTALLSNAKIVATNESSPQDLHGNPKQRSKPEQSTKHDPETVGQAESARHRREPPVERKQPGKAHVPNLRRRMDTAPPRMGEERTAPHQALSSLTEILLSDRPIEVLPHDSEMVRALKSANVEMLKELCIVMLDQDGYPPVCVAARFGLDNGLKTMLAAGASLTCSNREGEDPLILATDHQRRDTVATLLEHGAFVNVRGGVDDASALHYAVDRGDEDILRLLLENHADLNLLDSYDDSPLMCASRNGNIEAVELLLQYNADVNEAAQATPEESDANGWTALCYAAWFGHVEVAQQLLNAQADVEHETVNGDRPLHLAAKEGKIPLINLLLSYGVNSSSSLLQLKKWDGLCFDDDVSYPTQQKVIGVLRLHEKLNNTRRSLKFWK